MEIFKFIQSPGSLSEKPLFRGDKTLSDHKIIIKDAEILVIYQVNPRTLRFVLMVDLQTARRWYLRI